MHMPIYGSQINPAAKLYKRFTYEKTLKVPINAKIDADLTKDIILELNSYKNYYSFAFVETSDKVEGSHQPLNGLLVPKGTWSIKFNGRSDKREYLTPCDTEYAEEGDLIVIGKELWQICEGVSRHKYKSYIGMAVITLPLQKIL